MNYGATNAEDGWTGWDTARAYQEVVGFVRADRVLLGTDDGSDGDEAGHAAARRLMGDVKLLIGRLPTFTGE